MNVLLSDSVYMLKKIEEKTKECKKIRLRKKNDLLCVCEYCWPLRKILELNWII